MSEMDVRNLVAKNLTRLLEMAGMSQTELADRLGVSKTAVSSWCSGAKTPRADKVDAMAAIFGVSRSSFYEEARPDVVIVDARGDQLRKIFYQLNEEGQSKLLSYALDLKKIPGYLKQKPPLTIAARGGDVMDTSQIDVEALKRGLKELDAEDNP